MEVRRGSGLVGWFGGGGVGYLCFGFGIDFPHLVGRCVCNGVDRLFPIMVPCFGRAIETSMLGVGLKGAHESTSLIDKRAST